MTESNSVEIALSDFERKKLVEQIYMGHGNDSGPNSPLL
jgi:hypothetical protein